MGSRVPVPGGTGAVTVGIGLGPPPSASPSTLMVQVPVARMAGRRLAEASVGGHGEHLVDEPPDMAARRGRRGSRRRRRRRGRRPAWAEGRRDGTTRHPRLLIDEDRRMQAASAVDSVPAGRRRDHRTASHPRDRPRTTARSRSGVRGSATVVGSRTLPHVAAAPMCRPRTAGGRLQYPGARPSHRRWNPSACPRFPGNRGVGNPHCHRPVAGPVHGDPVRSGMSCRRVRVRRIASR